MILQYDPDNLTEYFSLNKARQYDDELRCCCPFKHYKPEKGQYYEKTPSFGINVETGKWNCFGCGVAGLSVSSLAWKLDMTPPPFARALVDGSARKRENDFVVYPGHLVALSQNVGIALDYFNSRDISIPMVYLWSYHIGASREGDVIYFPLFQRDKTLIGWVERRNEGDLRWILAPDNLDKSLVLFGNTVVKSKVGFLTESTTDVIKLRSWGYDAVSTCSSNIMDRQLEATLDLFDTIYLVPHNDQAGLTMTRKVINYLYNRCHLKCVRIPDNYKDVSDISDEEEFKAMVESAKTIRKPVKIPRKRGNK